jgi:hypothetical protein
MLTVPTPGQPTQWTGRASQHADPANQTIGQLQQLATMTQPAKAAPTAQALAEDAVLAGDIEHTDTGTAAGTVGAARAPIDIATVGAQQTEPEPATPAGRLA